MGLGWKKDSSPCLNMSDRKAIKYLYLTRAITPLIQRGFNLHSYRGFGKISPFK